MRGALRSVEQENAVLYERVADHVSSLIEHGALTPGDKLPSVRRLSRQQNVSVATVVHAYQLLEGRGLVETRPQSGHYVRRRAGTRLPEPRSARRAMTAARVSTADLVSRVYGTSRDGRYGPLGAAVPGAALLPTKKLNRIVSQIARTAGGAALAYDPPPGLPQLRRVIARRAAEAGCAIGPDDVVTTFGCMEALHLCLRASVRPGDAVAVETPTYYGLLVLLESMGLKVFEVPEHARTGMDLDALEQVLKTGSIKACLAVPNFSNPLGSLMSDEAKEKLVALLTRRDVPLVEDDISGDLYFTEPRPRPAKSFDRAGLVMLCSSVSKTLAPGYRVGWAIPGRYRERVEQLKFAQTVANASLPQMAVAEFLESGGYDHHLRTLRRSLAAQVSMVSDAIATHFPERTRISRPQGGFTLWVELPAGVQAIDLAARAFERGITIAPGPIFSAKQRFGSYIRISCGYPWSDEIHGAIRTLGELATRASSGH